MNEPVTVKVNKKYQIAVPAMARQQLNIQAGDLLLVDIQDGMMILMPEPANYTQAMQGYIKRFGKGLTHRSTWTRNVTHGRSHRKTKACFINCLCAARRGYFYHQRSKTREIERRNRDIISVPPAMKAVHEWGTNARIVLTRP